MGTRMGRFPFMSRVPCGWFPLFYISWTFSFPAPSLGRGKVSQLLIISLYHLLPSTTASISQCTLAHATPTGTHRDQKLSQGKAGQAGFVAVSRGCSQAHVCRFCLGLTTAAFFTCAPEMPAVLPRVLPLLRYPRVPFPENDIMSCALPPLHEA